MANHLELPSDFLERFRHSMPLQIRFNDVDRLGHVNNSIYQQFYDLGRLRYFEELLNPPIAWGEVVVVLAHLELDFMAPLFMEDKASVATRVYDIQARTFHMEQAIYNRQTGLVYSRADSVMVGFHAKAQRSVDLPLEWSSAMSSYEMEKGQAG